MRDFTENLLSNIEKRSSTLEPIILNRFKPKNPNGILVKQQNVTRGVMIRNNNLIMLMSDICYMVFLAGSKQHYL